MVPVGELPRHMMLHAERYVGKSDVPGTELTADTSLAKSSQVPASSQRVSTPPSPHLPKA